jgi:hypothetical protein
LTRQRIRRGAFSIADLQAAINAYLADNPNRHASGCRWIDATCASARGRLVGDHPNSNPDPKQLSTSYVERANLTMRMAMRRFMRLTNAFSKKLENHAHMFARYALWYNFVRIHKTLRTSPAMAAGIETRLWSMEDVVVVMDEHAARRAPAVGSVDWIGRSAMIIDRYTKSVLTAIALALMIIAVQNAIGPSVAQQGQQKVQLCDDLAHCVQLAATGSGDRYGVPVVVVPMAKLLQSK